MDPIFKLQAIEEIKQLKARYFRYVDSKNWDALAEVFAEDAEFDRTTSGCVWDPWAKAWTPAPPTQPVVCKGRAEIMNMIRRAVEDKATAHHGFMPEISIIDDSSAQGIWSMRDMLRTRTGELILEGTGHYHERYRCNGGRWAISHCRLARSSIQYGSAAPDPQK